MTFDWFRRRFDEKNPETDQSAETEQTSAPAEAADSAEADSASEQAEDYLNWAKVAYENIRKRQAEVAAAAPESASESAVAVPETAAPETAIAEVTEAEVTEAEVTEPVSSEAEVAEPASSEVEAAEAVVPELAPATETATGEPDETIPEPTPVAAESTVPTAEAAAVVDAPATEPVTVTPSAIAPEVPVASSEPAETPAVEASPAAAIAPPPEPTAAQSVAPVPFWAAAEAERQARLEQLRETAIQEPEPEPVATTAPVAEPEFPAIPDFVLDESFMWSAEVLAAQGRRPDQVSLEEITWLNRLRQGLDKTRRGLVNQLRAIVGQGPLNEDAVTEIEAALLQADVGIEATDAIISALQKKLRDEVLPPEAAIQYLKTLIRDMLDAPLGEYGNLTFVPEKDKLNIWLMTGVNGAGKTTTIGKLAHIANKSGYTCLIAAADTFRAAAVEQVKVWGARSEVEVIANPGKNTDPAAVVFDAITAAQAREANLLLVDTAGRLQNKKNLMDELSKVRRIIDKKAPDAVVESLLVLDSTLGQNGLRQAEVFSEAAKLSGVVLTKLDGTAKGGIALAVVQQLGLPIRFIGAGEGIEDLRPFSSYEFVEALLNG